MVLSFAFLSPVPSGKSHEVRSTFPSQRMLSNQAVQRSQTNAEELSKPRGQQQLELRHSSRALARFAHDFSRVPLNSRERAEAMHQLAQHGTAGSSGPLPYLDQIQQSFGHGYDLGRVKAHIGSEAAEAAQRMGAEAYTAGGRVAFGAVPSLRIAAHEAAHAVQQRCGARVPGGIGQTGDTYEQNADAVADRVVRGEQSADLLPVPQDGYPEAPEAQHKPVQMYAKVVGKPYDRLSDDGKLAVKDHSRKAWAESSNIANSNKVLDSLKAKAKIEEMSGGDITATPPGKAGTITLKQFRMIDRATSSEVELTDDCGTACQELLGAGAAGYESFVGVNKRGTTEEYTKPSKYEGDDYAPGGLISTTERMSGEIYSRIFERELKKTFNRTDALREWDKLSAAEKDRLSKKYGINKHAVPKVGQGITIGSERDMPGATPGGYNFHFGLNLMASGHDYITLEDYDSSGVKYYFDMYGPESKSQSWAEDPSNTGALGNRTTTMVVQHPESLNGIVNATGVHIEDDPAVFTGKKTLAKDTKVTIIRKGQSWMKVEVKSGPRVGESGWILNRHFTDN